MDAADLWFLPGPVADTPAASPDLQDWRAAEAGLAQPLARAAAAFGALDDRLRHAPAGLRHRLALREVSAMTWHLGARLPEDRLGLYLATRLSGATDSAQALARAGWSHRRLLAGQGLDPGDLAGFLNRAARSGDGAEAITRPQGGTFQALADHWAAKLHAAQVLHPFTRAALGWQLWRSLELSGDDGLEEGATAAAILGAEAGRGGAGFVPLALAGQAGARAYQSGGDAESRLAAWLSAVEQAALSGLMTCDRQATWQARAGAATARFSGRVPGQLIDALGVWPMASVGMLSVQIGASDAAVQRNLAKLQTLGLVREMTGQSRYRFWQIAD